MDKMNLFEGLPPPGAEEDFTPLLTRPGVRLLRIVSHGHASAEGFWYEQDEDEWVLLVQGEAALEFSSGETLALHAGEYVLIPAGCRHRVARTGPDTVWLALHVAAGNSA